MELNKGTSINYVGRRGGGRGSQILCYYISLCSKLAYVVYGWALKVYDIDTYFFSAALNFEHSLWTQFFEKPTGVFRGFYTIKTPEVPFL